MRIVLVLAALLIGARAAPVAIGSMPPVMPAKMIALSFDDAPRGPGAFLTTDQRNAMLIAALKAERVDQVAFFVNPVRISHGDGDEERIDRYVAAGHVIADHTYSHPRLSKVSAKTYLADIDKAEAWLKGRPGYRPWFRFPALDEGGPDKVKRDAVRAGLRARHLRNGYVTVDGSDWYLDSLSIAAKKAGKPIDMAALRRLYVETMVQSANFSDALMRRTLGRSPAHMLLLHETDLAALFMPDLIEALRNDGWGIVTADRAYADPIYDAVPEIAWANGTLAEQLAWQNHITGPRWYERNDIRVAKTLFTERVLHAMPAPFPSPPVKALPLVTPAT
ncbi:polysaccharide deacetylase family protein [Sphingomonas sp. ERG5]|uniref:polysaccharide deacetylase family protein n=1 Tax=Sphingomonas sp. ERG5 TaxID=1381597 RepID=UPI0009DD442B|nr:polysaccharide deacetylase family protein [Sphingomonas sp. ERG5]